jgi:hypothetical protein
MIMDVYTEKELSKAWSRSTLLFMLALMFVIDFPVVDIPNNFLVKDAEAVIGRPLTPGSVGGVRRRTRRRVRRRTAVVAYGTRVYALPAGCSKVVVGGVEYHNCGGVYYRPYYQGNQVVYEVVEKP